MRLFVVNAESAPMTDLYLIAHRVRGEPAFDIACMLEHLDDGGDPIWIIPTSGHRAYPWWYIELLGGTTEIGIGNEWMVVPPMPPDLQDHYHLEQTVRVNVPTLLSRLNLHRTQPPIIRRI